MDLSPIRLIDVASASADIVKQLQGARSVTAKVVDAAILTVARTEIENALAAELAAELSSVLEGHELIYGERSGGGSDPDQWESDLDDAVEELFVAKLQPFMGPGFVGEHSVETRIYEPGELEDFARKVAKGVAERMTTDKDAAASIAALFDKEELTKAGKEKPKDDGYKSVVVIVLADYLARNGDKGVVDLLDLASDDDEILAAGSLELLAGSYVNKEEIGRCMRVWRANSGTWRDEAITAALQANTPPQNSVLPTVSPEAAMSITGEPVEPTKPKRTRKKKGEAAAPAAETDEEREARELAELIGDVPAPLVSLAGVGAAPVPLEATHAAPNGTLQALTGLKEHGRITETDLAASLGLSRSSINNMVRGKIPCDFDAGQRTALAQAIDLHLKGLVAARAALGEV